MEGCNAIPLSLALSRCSMAAELQLSCGLAGSCKSACHGLGFPASEARRLVQTARRVPSKPSCHLTSCGSSTPLCGRGNVRRGCAR